MDAIPTVVYSVIAVFIVFGTCYVMWQVTGMGKNYARVKSVKKSVKKLGKDLKEVKKESAKAHAEIKTNIANTEEKTDKKIGELEKHMNAQFENLFKLIGSMNTPASTNFSNKTNQ